MEKKFKPLINKIDKDEITKLVDEYKINLKNLHISTEKNKYISGIFGKKINGDVRNYFKYNHFIESINDLSNKTKLSINLCADTYMKVDFNKVDFMNNVISANEEEAYYYLENALFREIILWDSLAQLYNLYFNLNLDIDRINYKKVIKKLKRSNPNDEIDFQEIYDYISEESDKTHPKLDVGIHDSINELRNQMTHRYSIAITSLFENINLRAMPDSLYKIARDYNKAQQYLIQIIKLICIEIKDNNLVDKILSGNLN